MSISSEFNCKCGKMKGWITEGETNEPCHKCGRVYLGFYDVKNLTISGEEIDRVCLNLSKVDKET